MAQWFLNIAGEPAPEQVSLVSFERNYDGPAKLVFRWDGDWRTPPWTTEAPVELKAVIGRLFLFKGLLDLPRPLASDRTYPAVEYTAYDLCRALSGPIVFPQLGNPTIHYPSGTLASVINKYLELVGEKLEAYGVETTVDYIGGADTIITLPVTLETVSIDEGFRRIAAAAPGVRVLLLPEAHSGALRYTFVNIFAAPLFNLVIDETRVPELTIQQSLDGRAGAVKTLEGLTWGEADVELEHCRDLAPAWGTPYSGSLTTRTSETAGIITLPSAHGITSGSRLLLHWIGGMRRWMLVGAVSGPNVSISGGSGDFLPEVNTLIVAIPAGLERRWTWKQAMALTPEGEPIEPELSKVYRRFSFEAFADEIDETTHMVAIAKPMDEGAHPLEWQRLTIASVDWTTKTLLLNLPALQVGSLPRIPGRSRAARVKLRYTEKGIGRVPIFIQSQRYPATGYAGRAYDLAPITCGYERIITIPSGVVASTYPQQAHAALSEPVVSGSIPIQGELSSELWELGRRLNITTATHELTGYEMLAAPVAGIRIDFAAGGSANIDFELDRSQLLQRET